MVPVHHPVRKWEATKQVRLKYKPSMDGTIHSGVSAVASWRGRLTRESGHVVCKISEATARAKQRSNMCEELIRTEPNPRKEHGRKPEIQMFSLKIKGSPIHVQDNLPPGRKCSVKNIWVNSDQLSNFVEFTELFQHITMYREGSKSPIIPFRCVFSVLTALYLISETWKEISNR